MINYLKQKFFNPFLDLLMQGISPEMLALSVSLGFIIGIIPMVGVTTAICALLALYLKLNIVAIQIVNYIAAPLQLVFYIPFIRIGEKIFGFTATDFTISEVLKLFDHSFINALRILWLANLQGIIIWMIISVPLSFMIYYLFLNIFRRFTPEESAED